MSAKHSPHSALPVLLTILCLQAFPAQATPLPATPGTPAVQLAAPQAPSLSGPQLAQSTGLPPGARGKRAGPAEVTPVVIGQVSYGALHFGKAEGLEQNGGYIEAKDKNSGARLWTLKVYDNRIDPNLESDVQDVFITAIKRRGQALEIVNEQGRRYRVDVKTKSVTAK